MIVRTGACLTGLLVCLVSAAAAPAIDCATEAAVLARDQSELSRLEVASRADRPPYCITIETLMAFAGRVKAHVARCPNSGYAEAVSEWDKPQTDYAKLFGRHRCKRTR